MMSLCRRMGRRGVIDEFVSPRDEVFHVATILVSAVVLSPCEFSIKQTGVHWWFLGGAIVVGIANVSYAQKAEYWTSGHRRHVAALLIKPVGIALFGNAVADEC